MIIEATSEDEANRIMQEFLEGVSDYVHNKNHIFKLVDGGGLVEICAILNYVCTVRDIRYHFFVNEDGYITYYILENHLKECYKLNDAARWFKKFYRHKNIIKDIFR